ncbi:uncharacterized protein LOC111915216 [Lactuca sativa]|uniref:Myb-like domain-containing protein n=1 Tax=Lactuca sativa TaxID=4236 RepID=A0A9R1WLR5_LACSA|nr:uncharacterized protein LOC111915216 [Lactuca sativa]KAJ0224985.1 hypothetical protein LSAT_V11C100021720 [Lactuca sativa]
MNQVEEESLYHSLEEEAIDVDCLLVEPRSDQVSVSSVWCFEEDNIGKCIKTEDASYNLGGSDSNINMECVDTTKLNALDVLPHEVGVENLLTSNGISPCDDYLIDIGYVDHGACIDYVSNEPLHVGNSSSESPFPMFRNKGNFGIQNSLTDSIPESECQNYFLGNIFGTESKTVDKFEDFSKSFIDEEDDEGNLPLQFAQTGMELTPFRQDLITNSAQEHGVGGITHKRSRKPTKRYIDESSNLTLKNCKKRKEPSSMSKVKMSTVRRVKSQNEVKPKENIQSSEISFGKAIQVPFISQCPTECEKISLPTTTENQIESFSSGSGDDSETQMMRSMTGGNQRKLHRLWTVTEVKKLIDGVAHFGVGKWTHIKKLLFSSSVHRTPVDLKDKWRNLLKASRALKGSRVEDEQKRSQPWRPLPKSILCRVRELASTYPYPREANNNSKISKSKFPIVPHVSFSEGIKGNKVPVV